MADLLCCPFCGSLAALEECDGPGGTQRLFWIECKGDDCGISGRIRLTPEDAITAWSRRATAGVNTPDGSKT